jgi:uncharacterized protein (TIGR00251 family)
MIYEVEVKFHKDFVAIEGNKITIGLISRPEDGKANRELIKKLAQHFDVSSSQVRIVSGTKGRKKVVWIEI